MRFSDKTHTDASLDITPIVDTVFNLLIFFALSLNFIVTPGIKVDLPESITEEIIREREELIVVMDKDNNIFIDENTVSIDQLVTIFTKTAQKSKDTLVIIQADQEVAHGNVVMMMDRAKKAGLVRLAIATAMKKKTLF
jgi:biopolymer transport protein ExbD